MFYRGEDFRPAYKEVLCLRSIIEAPVLAITGTCNEKVKKNIFSYLALTDEVSVAVVPDRYVFYFIYLNNCMILIVVWSINNQFSLYYVQEKLFYRVYQKLVHFQAKYLSWYPRVKTKSWDWSPVDGGLLKCWKNECKENYSLVQV